MLQGPTNACFAPQIPDPAHTPDPEPQMPGVDSKYATFARSELKGQQAEQALQVRETSSLKQGVSAPRISMIESSAQIPRPLT